MSDIAIKLVDVHKVYKLGKGIEVHALRGVNLIVRKGELISIMGPSGSGKTTLLNIIGTMDKPTRGRVYIEDLDVTDFSEDELVKIRREKIGYVFQAYNLITTLTALENVMLPLLLTGWYTEKEAKEKAVELLRLVGLEERANHKPHELSGGQQQRVAVARALANDPAFVLMDEPTGALDTITGAKLMELVKMLNESFGQTFIIVTHNPDVARYTAKIYYIRDGRIYPEAPKEALGYTSYLSRDEKRALIRSQLNILKSNLVALKRRYESGEISEDVYVHMKKRMLERLDMLARMVRS